MTKNALRIGFLGTPTFAATSLEKLIVDGYNIVVVVSIEDKKKGRGQKIQESEVKICAAKYGLPCLQPQNLKDPEFFNALKSYALDLGVVVAFRMLPESIWTLPKLGTINLHASLLPNYRGAAPINWAIINGEKKTGVTTFFLKHEIDTGDILMQEEVTIDNSWDAGMLHDQLMVIGAEVLSNTIKGISEETIETIPQQVLISDLCGLKKAPKIFKEDCLINWNLTEVEVKNFIRGLSPFPGAFSRFLTLDGNDITFKVFKVETTDKGTEGNVGKIVCNSKDELMIGCVDYFVKILSIQVEGKRKMDIKDFLLGFKMDNIHLNIKS